MIVDLGIAEVNMNVCEIPEVNITPFAWYCNKGVLS